MIAYRAGSLAAFFLLLLLLLLAMARCKPLPSRLAQREQERDLKILDEARRLLEKHPGWKDSLARTQVDTVYVPRVEYQTKLITRYDTVTLHKYIDTMSVKLFGTIDGLQARLLKQSIKDMADKMQLGRMPDTTITFTQTFSVYVAGKEYVVKDTVQLEIKGLGHRGYEFRVGNQAKRIPVNTINNQITITPAITKERQFWQFWQFWLAAALAGLFFCLLVKK